MDAECCLDVDDPYDVQPAGTLQRSIVAYLCDGNDLRTSVKWLHSQSTGGYVPLSSSASPEAD